jgi:hypothetical protein
LDGYQELEDIHEAQILNIKFLFLLKEVRKSAPVWLAYGIHEILYFMTRLLVASFTVGLISALIGEAVEEGLYLAYRVELGDGELRDYEDAEVLHMVQEDVVVHCREDEFVLIGFLPILGYPLQGPDYNLLCHLFFLLTYFLLSGA